MEKVLFSDIDGTLMSESIEMKNEIIDLLKNKDNNIVLTTGRSYNHVKTLFKKYDLDLNCICSNGSEVIINHEIHRINCLDSNKVLEVIQDIENRGYTYVIVTANGNVINENCDAFDLALKLAKLISDEKDEILKCINIFYTSIYENAIKVPDMIEYAKNCVDDILKIEIFSEIDKDILKQEIQYDDVNIFSSHISNLEITPSGVSKANGIKYYLEKLNLDPIIYTVGDGENDIDMFEIADKSFAMGNAEDKIKQKADIVVSSVVDLGVLDVIKFINEDTNTYVNKNNS